MTDSALSVTVNPVEAVLNLDKSDIIAVAMAEFETSTQTDIAILDQQINKLGKDLRSNDGEFKKLVRQEADKAAKLPELKKAVKLLGFHEDCILIQVHLERDDNGEANISVLVFEEPRIPGSDKAKDPRGAHYNRHGHYRNGESYISRTLSFKISKAAEALYQGGKELEKQQNALMEEVLNLRAKLSDIPRMERTAKAQLARHALEQTAEGKEILDQLATVQSLPELVQQATSTPAKKKVATKKKTTKKKKKILGRRKT
jgi:hypothetical protein